MVTRHERAECGRRVSHRAQPLREVRLREQGSPSIRDSFGIRRAPALGIICSVNLERPLSTVLAEIIVDPGTYRVSPEPVILLANLAGALALCLHDEARGVGGLLHLNFTNGDGRPSDVTDNTLSSVLVLLDRFKRAVMGDQSHEDEVQARVIAHALPPAAGADPEPASMVDLIQADFADGKVHCGSQLVRRQEGICVCFEPFQGRVWISGPNDQRRNPSAQRKLQAASPR